MTEVTCAVVVVVVVVVVLVHHPPETSTPHKHVVNPSIRAFTHVVADRVNVRASNAPFTLTVAKVATYFTPSHLYSTKIRVRAE